MRVQEGKSGRTHKVHHGVRDCDVIRFLEPSVNDQRACVHADADADHRHESMRSGVSRQRWQRMGWNSPIHLALYIFLYGHLDQPYTNRHDDTPEYDGINRLHQLG